MEDKNEDDTTGSDMYTNDIWSIDVNDDESTNTTELHHHGASLNSGSCVSNRTPQHATAYTSKKPLWWKRQSGRKISLRQRQAIQEIQELGLQLKLPILPKETGVHHNQRGEDINHTDHLNESLQQPLVPIKSRPKVNWNTVFPTYSSSVDEIWLEIGFGLGDNLLCLASANAIENLNKDSRQNPRSGHRFFVGAEMHKGGVGTICTRIQEANHKKEHWKDFKLFAQSNGSIDCNSHIDTDSANKSDTTGILYGNLRLHMGDGIKLLPFIPDHSISAVLITFPDPFMGTNQASFRILQLDVLDEIRRILVSSDQVIPCRDIGSISSPIRRYGGGRLYLATDHFGFHEWSHEQVTKFNDQMMRQAEQARGVDTELSSTLSDCDRTCEYMQPKNISGTFKAVEPPPDRSLWLPIISKYEQKGYDEGRQTYLSCWEML